MPKIYYMPHFSINIITAMDIEKSNNSCPGLNHICVWLGPAPPTPPSLPNLARTCMRTLPCWELL